MSGRFDDLIYTTTLQPDGKIIVGGAFTSYDGSSALRLIRLNADGSRYIFDSREGFKYNDTVNTTTLQPDGKIIVGGYFTSYDGSSALRLIRLNPDGSRDTTFNIGG
ncbi:MAG: delta-60 repeat domain-containing protein [Candidatus Peribacteria bacterium]|nr:MAG: delta-60 repeat domain-containing protein [Candidatus Peribacteria bacterium]